jgi:hypothetical protein
MADYNYIVGDFTLKNSRSLERAIERNTLGCWRTTCDNPLGQWHGYVIEDKFVAFFGYGVKVYSNDETPVSLIQSEEKFTCGKCGEVHPISVSLLGYSVELQREFDEVIMCEECYNRYVTHCYHCGREVWRNTTHFGYCPDCQDYYQTCPRCGRYIHDDDYDFEYDMCRECVDEMEDEDSYNITSYHSHTYHPVGKGNKFKGIELEVDNGDDREECTSDLWDNYDSDRKHFYFEDDGSLSDDGFELITHPHTIEEFNKLNWNGIFNTIRSYRFVSHDADNCGLHIHYSREWFGKNRSEQDYNIGKLLAFYERNLPHLFMLSRRTEENFRQWASAYNSTGNCKTCADIVKKGKYSRYKMINLCNTRTIEFRLARGTLNLDTFNAWNDLHDCLVKNVKRTSYKDIDNFEKWFNGIKVDTVRHMADKGVFTSFCSEFLENYEKSNNAGGKN